MRFFISVDIQVDIDPDDYHSTDETMISGLLAQEFLDDPQGWINGLDADFGDSFLLEVGRCADPE